MPDDPFDMSVLDGPPQVKRRFGGRQPGSGRPKYKSRPLDQVYPGLPDSKDPAADAMWVYNNSERMVQELKKDGKIVIWWERASEPPPSRGVEGWMKLRQKTGYKDFHDRLGKAITGRGDDDEDEADVQRYEKKRLEEVRKILENMIA